MRIESNVPLTEAAQTERVSGVNGQPTSSTAKARTASQPESGVTINSDQFRATLEATPDIRQEKVAALQKSMREGTYHVSNQDLANAVFNALVTKSKP